MSDIQPLLYADLVLRCGKVWTVDNEMPWAESIAVKSGKIVFIGKDEDIKRWISQDTHVIDLGGKFVLPGFNDAHVHFHPNMLQNARECGITTIQDITFPSNIQEYKDLYESGNLTVRLTLRLPITHWRDFSKYRDMATCYNGMLTVVGLKGYVDGKMSDNTALLFESYEDAPGNYGRLADMMRSEENMSNLLKGAVSIGATPSIHAIGDKAVHILLNLYEKIIDKYQLADHRFRVVHAQVVYPKDFKRFGEMMLVAEVNPFHCLSLPWVKKKIGCERSRWAYAFRSLKDNGALLCFGSDHPGPQGGQKFPLNPLLGIYAAVTRGDFSTKADETLHTNEKLTVREAIEAYTINPAIACFEEDIKGTISLGKVADMAVLSENLFDIPLTDIPNIKVFYTILGGKIVYLQ